MPGSAEPGTKKVLETTYILKGCTTTQHVTKRTEIPWCLMKTPICWALQSLAIKEWQYP